MLEAISERLQKCLQDPARRGAPHREAPRRGPGRDPPRHCSAADVALVVVKDFVEQGARALAGQGGADLLSPRPAGRQDRPRGADAAPGRRAQAASAQGLPGARSCSSACRAPARPPPRQARPSSSSPSSASTSCWSRPTRSARRRASSSSSSARQAGLPVLDTRAWANARRDRPAPPSSRRAARATRWCSSTPPAGCTSTRT